MRVLAIRGANLASLAGEFEVRLDADPLASAGLFAITGPTGAGKSTLLDALCVALYDKTPRLHSRGGALIGREGEPEEARISASDVRALLSRGAGEGYAEVDIVGRDGQPLRATWQVRRARGRPSGRIQHQTMAVRDLSTDRVVSGPKSEILAAIEARIGLSFAQFRRSVVLPQGDFAAFLRAAPQDRAALLERMTGTEIYGRVSAAAFRKAADEEKKLAAMAEAAARYAILEDGEREALEGERQRVVAARDAAKKSLATAESRARWHLRARELAGGEQAAMARLSRSREAREQSGALRDELSATEAAMLLAPEVDRADAAAAALEAAKSEVDKRRQEVEQAAAARNAAEMRRQRAEAAIARAREKAERSCRDARQAHAAAVFEAEAATARAAEKPVAEAREHRDRLIAEREVFRAVAAAARECLAHDGDITAARAEIESAREQGRGFAGEAEKLALEDQRMIGAVAEAEHNLDEARRRESLAGHRGSLCDGEPCPLCGSTEHPWADAAEALSAAAIDAAERLKTLSQRRREIESALAHARAQLAAQARAEKAAAARARAARAAKENAASAYAAAASDLGQLSGLDDPADPKTHAWLAAKLESLAASIAEASVSEAEATELARLASSALGTAEARRIDREHAEAKLGATRDRRADEEIRAVDSATLRESTARAMLAGAEERRDGAVELAAGAAENLATAMAAAHTGESELRARIARGQAWIERTRDKITAVNTAWSEARAVAEERARQRQEHSTLAPPGCEDSDACAARCHAVVKDAAAHLERLTRELSEAESTLRADDAARARRGEMTAEIAARRKSLEAYQMLSELIGSADGRKLRVFAQSLTLDTLIVYANDHLADLCDRYRLARIPGRDLDLQVIDRDLGDEVRSLNSLSGGETFLAALALALALASLSAADAHIGSLLIDEGFGSLDVDTLDVALSVLEALHASGRQVGLISHVPGIAERIGAQVRVIPRGGGKSAVRVLAS